MQSWRAGKSKSAGRPACWIPKEDSMLQFVSKGSLEAEFPLPQETSVFPLRPSTD